MNSQNAGPDMVTARPPSAGTTSSSTTQDHGQGSDLEKKGTPKELPNYNPWIMHSWPLFSFCILTLILVVTTCIVWIYQKSQDTGPYIAYFAFVYLVLETFLLNLDSRVKGMEPFYQMSKPEGAAGSGSLCVDYFYQSLYLTPFTAMYHGHWAVVCSSLALVNLHVIHTISNHLYNCTYQDNSKTCTDLTYAFEGASGFLVLLLAALAILLNRRSRIPGATHYPADFEALIKCTGGMKLDNSLYALFKLLDDEISEEELGKAVGPHRFQLKRRDLDTGDPGFDIVIHEDSMRILRDESLVVSETTSQSLIRRVWNGFRNFLSWLPNCSWVLRLSRVRKQWLWKDNHPFLFQKVPLTMIIPLIIGLFIVATGQPFSANISVSFAWLGGETFTIFMILDSNIWVKINKFSNTYRDIYHMHRGGGAPYSLLRYKSLLWPFQDLYDDIVSLKRDNWKGFSKYVDLVVTVGTYTSTTFLWALAFLPQYNDGSASVVICISIMIPCEVIMVLELLVLFRYRRHPFLPRQPTTLASKLLLVYATDIIEEDAGPMMSTMSTIELPACQTSTSSQTQDGHPPPQQTLTREGDDSKETKAPHMSQYKSTRIALDFIEDNEDGRCAFGWFSGRDRKDHLGICKYDPDMRSYKLSPKRQKQIDDGTVISSINQPAAEP